MRTAISCTILALILPAVARAQPASTDKPLPAQPAADGGGAPASAPTAPTRPATNSSRDAAGSTGGQSVAPVAQPGAAESSGNATAPAGGPAVAPTAPSASQPASACGAAQFADEVIMGVSRTNLCPKPVDPTLELLSAKLERAPSKSTPLFFEVLRELRDHMHAQTTLPGGQVDQAAAIPPEQPSAADARNATPAAQTGEQQTGRQQHAAAQAGQAAGAAGQAHGREQREAAAGPDGQGVVPAAADSGAEQATNDWRLALADSIDEAFAQAKAEQHPSAGFAAVRGVTAELDPDACLFMTGDAGQPDYACYVLKAVPQPLNPGSMHVYELASLEDAYLAHRALAIAYSALVKLDLRDLDIAIKRLKQAEQRWESLRKRGYLQYPWELALSSVLVSYRDYQACFALDAFCTGEEGLDPERTRLIALHPGVGLGFSGFGRHPKPSADAALALSLELIGLTRYADDFETYFGASLGAVVNDGDFRDVRPGVFVHLTRWLHVGYLVSLFRSATRYDATLFISSDLGTAFGADFLE